MDRDYGNIDHHKLPTIIPNKKKKILVHLHDIQNPTKYKGSAGALHLYLFTSLVITLSFNFFKINLKNKLITRGMQT